MAGFPVASEALVTDAPRSLPYGSWPSPLSAARVSAGALRLSQPQIDAGQVHWIEGRPSEGGRQVALRRDASGAVQELVGQGDNVRTCVHEYGGGDYLAKSGRFFSLRFPGGELRERHASGEETIWMQSSARYADLDLSPDGEWLVAVEEHPEQGREPKNRLVALRVGAGCSAPAEPLRFALDHDFVSFPRFAPDGRSLVFTSWEHPDMPWDGTRLQRVGWGKGGPLGAPQELAGGRGESIFQPRFSPGGTLTFVSDRSGWWNLHQWIDGTVQALCVRELEFGRPQWQFGMSRYAFVDEQRILCAIDEGDRDRLVMLDLERAALEDLQLDFSTLGGVQVEKGVACFIGASATAAPGVFRLELATLTLECVRSAQKDALDFPEARISVPEAIEFPTTQGRTAHAFYYAPKGFESEAPGARALTGLDGEKAPLLVRSHGGPTAATSSALALGIQYWTSRGIAVVDVNYGGSTGYGRAYRERLDGLWGIVDVEDCVAAAQFLAREGRIDSARMAISGGSAGGYTTLCALTFHDTFAAGASHYGIGDLEALVRDTHKFESRYMDALVGPYPEEIERYRARSPIHHTEQLSCPVIFFQGLEDRVVPPNQAQAMVAALAERGITHAYVPFEGEQHGFRRAENICTALDGELYFYSRVFGFEAQKPAALTIVSGR